MFTRSIVIICLMLLALPFGMSVAHSELPVCKSAAGRVGAWEFVVAPDDGATTIQLQMYRKLDYAPRLVYVPDNKSYFSVLGKEKKNISTAKLLVDNKTAAIFNRPKTGNRTLAFWRGKDYDRIYNALLQGKSGQMVITNLKGQVSKFDISLKDYIAVLHQSVPHFKRISKLYREKKCRGAFDF
ncbi:MAG: hypothetical protein DHS20C08_01530 [Rhodomicrobium sp.]|nr:MAG: hypothetical protein DHS20C08_01530 [Rhodomicrobium sp.]